MPLSSTPRRTDRTHQFTSAAIINTLIIKPFQLGWNLPTVTMQRYLDSAQSGQLSRASRSGNELSCWLSSALAGRSSAGAVQAVCIGPSMSAEQSKAPQYMTDCCIHPRLRHCSSAASAVRRLPSAVGNESVPKIIINNTMKLFFITAIRILVISNHNSFRVLSDEIASVYFI